MTEAFESANLSKRMVHAYRRMQYRRTKLKWQEPERRFASSKAFRIGKQLLQFPASSPWCWRLHSISDFDAGKKAASEFQLDTVAVNTSKAELAI